MRRHEYRAWDKKENKMIYNVERTYDFGCSGWLWGKQTFVL